MFCFALLTAAAVEAREVLQHGTIAGRVEAPGGAPVGGAVISVYGSGRGSFLAVSDGEGRFSLDLPPGRYTLRTLAGGFLAPAARRVRVAAERELLLDISLATEAAAASLAAAQVDPASVKELRWLIRHKRRSVLEDKENEPFATEASPRPAEPKVEGACWILAAPPASGPATAAVNEAMGASAVAVHGAIPGGRWSAGGVWPDGHTPAWRAAAELNVSSGPRLEWRAASAYAGREGVGTLLTEGRWRITSRLAATAGLRFTHGPTEVSARELAPAAGLELSGLPGRTRLRIGSRGGTRLAGGDPLLAPGLPVGTLSASGGSWPARRGRRHDADLERRWRVVSIGILTFAESTEPKSAAPLLASSRLAAQGAGVRVAGYLGDSLRAAVTYAGGRRGTRGSLDAERPFQEVISEVEARLHRSDTRLTAYYRFHRAQTDDLVQRFDVQVHQGLPFLDGFARSRWEVLVGVRNLVYESLDAGSLDDLSVHEAPARLVGGVSVKF